MAGPLVLALFGIACLGFDPFLRFGKPSLWSVAGLAFLLLGAIGYVALWLAGRIPRLAYNDGELLVYLRSLRPLRVPVDAVECFFLGQGPAQPAVPDDLVVKAANVIVRIGEGATAWHARKVRAELGQWQDGYITIRGMWCEPLSHERVNELNRRLAEAQRQLRQQQAAT
jgi:hypothetical protein